MDQGLNQSILVLVGSPAESANIQLTDDAVPVQKPACTVPISLKEKFKLRSNGETGNNFKIRL